MLHWLRRHQNLKSKYLLEKCFPNRGQFLKNGPLVKIIVIGLKKDRFTVLPTILHKKVVEKAGRMALLRPKIEKLTPRVHGHLPAPWAPSGTCKICVLIGVKYENMFTLLEKRIHIQPVWSLNLVKINKNPKIIFLFGYQGARDNYLKNCIREQIVGKHSSRVQF